MDARGSFPSFPRNLLFIYFPIAPPQNPQQKAPEICVLYALDVPASAVRAVIRQRFERNRHLSDPDLIDILLHKSRVEYQETMNFWKQESHVLGLLLTGNRERPHRTFLQKFFEGGLPIWSVPVSAVVDNGCRSGRDEDAVLPASPNV
jgi:NADH dehydrogenase (ubiquinone) 1 alpha subcomplex subunit 6